MKRVLPPALGIALGILAVWLALPFTVDLVFPTDSFVTNGRGDGPPVVTITDGSLKYGEHGTPRVHVDWLARREFHDHRAVFLYRDNALGPNVCSLEVPAPSGGFRDRKGSVQPEEGYSLDRWTNFTLGSCDLKPGNYVAVTEYRVKVWRGLFEVTFALTSNIFTIREG